MIRETQKDITLSGRKWRIKKFSAMVGSYICLKILSKISHIVVGMIGGELKDPAIIASAISNELGSLSKSELFDIQRECLSVCSEIQVVAGVDAPIPVFTEDGKWGVANLETDVLTVMALTVHTLIFNLSPFFDVSVLKEAFGSFPDFTQPKQPI